MKKLTVDQQKEALTNSLKYYQLFEKYFIHATAHGRTGAKFAIASNTSHGGIDTHSRFMTYDEFNSWFSGYAMALNKKL